MIDYNMQIVSFLVRSNFKSNIFEYESVKLTFEFFIFYNSLLNILRERYNLNRIYSNIGSILVSINPFKALPLYTPQQIDLYKDNPRDKPPHVFAVGYNAYYELINERKNQSIIITGESGAGKSEACKLVLQFIADLSANHCGKTILDDDSSLEQQLLQVIPISFLP